MSPQHTLLPAYNEWYDVFLLVAVVVVVDDCNTTCTAQHSLAIIIIDNSSDFFLASLRTIIHWLRILRVFNIFFRVLLSCYTRDYCIVYQYPSIHPSIHILSICSLKPKQSSIIEIPLILFGNSFAFFIFSQQHQQQQRREKKVWNELKICEIAVARIIIIIHILWDNRQCSREFNFIHI